MRIAPSALDGTNNVVSLLGSHLALLAYWCVVFGTPAGYWLAPLAPIACLLHQKAMSEWLHEAAHGNLVDHRRWNDTLAQWLCALFFFEHLPHYRRQHFRHHQDGGFFETGDPDTAALAIRTRGDLRRAVLQDLSGLTALHALTRRASAAETEAAITPRWRLGTLVVNVSMLLAWIACAVALGLAFERPAWLAVLVYLVTLATLYPLFNRLRVYAQHAELGEAGTIIVGSRTTRTLRVEGTGVLDRIWFSSKVLLFHAEHHAHSALPYRQLESLSLRRHDVSRHARSRLWLLHELYSGLPAA